MGRTCLSFMLITACGAAFAGSGDTAWFREAKYGVFVHFLGGGPEWNRQVDAFDSEAFADQMARAGAGYVIFTLGQNSGYYCSPNAAYDTHCGYAPGEHCSRRDLPMDLANALGKKGIRLMLYLPSRSPQQDKKAMAGLGDVNEQEPAPQEFTGKWSEVIREWSERYGEKVWGWWFDGAYNTVGWDDLGQPQNWNTWAAACRAGNPASILAFNPGTNLPKAFQALTPQQDYTAGEQNAFTATPEAFPTPSTLQWHILAHLGTMWARPDGPQLEDAAMVAYIRKVNAQGGVVSMDVNVTSNGTVCALHQAQLEAIREGIRGESAVAQASGDGAGATLGRL